MKKSKRLNQPSKILIAMILMLAGAGILQAQEYGFMYIGLDDFASTDLIPAGNWYQIGSRTNQADPAEDDFTLGAHSGVSSAWGETANELVVPASSGGTYSVKFSFSFEQTVNSPTTWDIAVCKNESGSTILGSNIIGQTQRSLSSSNKDLGNTFGSYIVDLAAGDIIQLYVKPSIQNTLQIWQAQVMLVELTNETTAYAGWMYVPVAQEPQSLGTAFSTLTGFSKPDAQNSTYWNLNSNTLTAQSNLGAAGDYLVSFSVSFIGSGNNPQFYTIGISDNGNTDMVRVTRDTDGEDYGNVVGCGIISIANGNPINLVAKSSNSSNISIQNASVVLHKLSGATSSAYGGMKIVTDPVQTVSVSLANTPYKVYNFDEESVTLNNWNFNASTDDLNATPGTLSAGNYYCEYSATIQSALATVDVPDNITVMVYVDESEQAELTIIRQLASSTDVGSIGGVGIINISSASTKVDLRVKNSNAHAVTFNLVSLNLNQISVGTHDGSLPVELSKWSASSGRGDVTLAWTTESEIENQGFIIERKLSDASEFRQIASYMSDETLSGQGSTTKQTEYAFIDRDVSVGESYDYRLCDVDYKGKIAQHDIISVVVSQEENTQQPVSLSLMHAYPNPFNPATTIEYGFSQASPVKLTIYDVGGNEIARLVEGPQEAGWHTAVWNGLNNQGQAIPTGVYLVHLQDQTHSKVIKISYLK